MPKLVISYLGGKSEQEFAQNATLGRSSRCTVCIKDIKLSRVHCEIIQDEADFILVDLHSQNGTRVNGRLITERILQHQDKIMIGKSEIVVLLDESPNTAPHEAAVADGQPTTNTQGSPGTPQTLPPLPGMAVKKVGRPNNNPR